MQLPLSAPHAVEQKTAEVRLLLSFVDHTTNSVAAAAEPCQLPASFATW